MTPEQRADFAEKHRIEPQTRNRKGKTETDADVAKEGEDCDPDCVPAPGKRASSNQRPKTTTKAKKAKPQKSDREKLIAKLKKPQGAGAAYNGTMHALSRRRAQQIVAEELLQHVNVDLRNDGANRIRPFDVTKDKDIIRQLMVHGCPKVPDSHKLRSVTTNGLSVHLTYGIKDKTGPGEVDKEPKDKTNMAEDSTNDGNLKWDGKRVPPKQIGLQTIVTGDPGVGEIVYTRLPDKHRDLFASFLEGKNDNPQERERLFQEDDAAKTKGNRQCAGAVYNNVAQTKMLREAEKFAIVCANRALLTATPRIPRQPVTVERLQKSLTDLARCRTNVQLLSAILARARAAPALLFAYFQPAFRQNYRCKELAVNRFTTQVVRSVLRTAQPPVASGGKPAPLWTARREQIDRFSDKTRSRQQREGFKGPRRKAAQTPLNTLVLGTGAWSRPTSNSGMTRKAGSFPRVQLQKKIVRDLEHRCNEADEQRQKAWTKANEKNLEEGKGELDARRSTLFYSCMLDEYRSSKNKHKVRDLLSDERSDKVNPTAETKAWTTRAKNGKAKSFKIVDHKPWGLTMWVGHDGRKHVSDRDEATNAAMGSVVIAGQLNQPRLLPLSRVSITSRRRDQAAVAGGPGTRAVGKSRG